jgi:hypothetical protein
VVISGHQWSSVAIRGHQGPSVVIRGRPSQSGPIKGHRTSRHQSPSVVIIGHQWSSVVISGHQWPSKAIGPVAEVVEGGERTLEKLKLVLRERQLQILHPREIVELLHTQWR